MLFFMWFSMMIAMMTPSVSPMVMMFTTVSRQRTQATAYAPTFIFLTGYLVAWALFSILASAIQWPLHGINLA